MNVGERYFFSFVGRDRGAWVRVTAKPGKISSAKGNVDVVVEEPVGVPENLRRFYMKGARLSAQPERLFARREDVPAMKRNPRRKRACYSRRRKAHRNPRKAWTVAAIARRNKAAGGHFFDRGTLKFFGETMSSYGVKAAGGKVFVVRKSDGKKWPVNARGRIGPAGNPRRRKGRNMQWGEYVVSVAKKDGSLGNFFTGTKQQCELVAYGIKMAGKKARIVKPEVKKP